MPRVSLPAAPASDRKHGVCATYFMGKAAASMIWSRTRLVTGTSAVGIRKKPGSPRTANRSCSNFGSWPGALQRRGVHEIGHVRLAIAMLAHVQIEHELGERAMQPRKRSGHHHEARTRDAPRRLEVHPQARADRHVILGLKGERTRLAPAAHLHVVGLIASRAARWHAECSAGRAECSKVRPGSSRARASRAASRLCAQGFAELDQRRRVSALCFRLTGGLGIRVALRAQT